MSTEKKQYQWDGRKYTSDQDGLVEESVGRGKTLPIITDGEFMPISESEEAELVQIGQNLEERGFLTDAEKARAKELLKKRTREPEFSSKPSISMDAVKVFFKG